MLTRMTAVVAAFGVAALAATGALGATGSYRQQIASALAQQFDEAAPHHVRSERFGEAMALRREARANYRHDRYGQAISELRTALNDIRTLPLPYAGVPPPKKVPSFPGQNADSG